MDSVIKSLIPRRGDKVMLRPDSLWLERKYGLRPGAIYHVTHTLPLHPSSLQDWRKHVTYNILLRGFRPDFCPLHFHVVTGWSKGIDSFIPVGAR